MIKNESSSLEGTWSPQWSRWEDEPTSSEELSDVTLKFADGKFEVRRGRELIRRGAYSNDASQSPNAIDVHVVESDVPELIGVTLLGIYEVRGEQLRICYGPPDGARAPSFSAAKGTGQYLGEYRRVREVN